MGAGKEVKKGCGNCKHGKVSVFQAPCSDCFDQSLWEPKRERNSEVKLCCDCSNEKYCRTHPHVAIGCKFRGMDSWSPVNVIKATEKEQDEFLKTVSREIPEAFAEPAVEDVSNQSHYTRFKIQPIEFCKANDLGYLEGCVIKYVCRYPYKGAPVKDLLKARDYIDHLITKQKEKEENE